MLDQRYPNNWEAVGQVGKSYALKELEYESRRRFSLLALIKERLLQREQHPMLTGAQNWA